MGHSIHLEATGHQVQPGVGRVSAVAGHLLPSHPRTISKTLWTLHGLGRHCWLVSHPHTQVCLSRALPLPGANQTALGDGAPGPPIEALEASEDRAGAHWAPQLLGYNSVTSSALWLAGTSGVRRGMGPTGRRQLREQGARAGPPRPHQRTLEGPRPLRLKAPASGHHCEPVLRN